LKPGSAWWKQPKPGNMDDISSVQQLVDALEKHKHRLVVVEVGGPVCGWLAGWLAAGYEYTHHDFAQSSPAAGGGAEQNQAPNQNVKCAARCCTMLHHASMCSLCHLPQFYAAWCSGCKAAFPHVLQLAAAHPGVRFLLIDFDDNKASHDRGCTLMHGAAWCSIVQHI
jgi:thiol-disulfide isomerase/thioredoxin